MTPRTQRVCFVAAAVGLCGLFVALAAITPVLHDDWFQLRYRRDHAFSPGEIWA